MSNEITKLLQNGTWELVPPSPSQNIVDCKWVFLIKHNLDGSISKFKARLVAKGFYQRPGIYFHDIFSLIVKPTTIRLIIAIALSNGWSLRQLDVNNVFLHGTLSEEVFMQQPPGFVDQANPNFVCRLRKAVYSLKQAPRVWYNELKRFLLSYGFVNSHSDTYLFIYHTSIVALYLLVYVNDLIVTGNTQASSTSFCMLYLLDSPSKTLGISTIFSVLKFYLPTLAYYSLNTSTFVISWPKPIWWVLRNVLHPCHHLKYFNFMMDLGQQMLHNIVKLLVHFSTYPSLAQMCHMLLIS